MATTENGSAVAVGAKTAGEVLEFAAERGVQMVDLKFIDLPGTWQHMQMPLTTLDPGDFESGLGFDGSSIRGFQEIHESDMLLMPDPATAFIDPFYTIPDGVADLLGRRPGARRAVRARSAVRCAEGGAVAGLDRDRGRRVLRPGGGVLRVRPHGLRATRAPRLLRDRLLRGVLEHGRGRRRPEPRLQAAPEGGLLPRPAGRLDGESARRDGDHDGVARDHLRVPPPRGRLRRPGRDRHALRTAAADRRPDDDLQVRGQERRRARRQDRDVHAEADLRRERLGHARPSVAVARRRAADVRPGRLRAPVRAGEALHRRTADARAGAARVLRADDELVPAAGARATRRP